MDLEKLHSQKIDMQIYDDLSISFNDATGAMKTATGEQVNFGTKLTWKLPPLV